MEQRIAYYRSKGLDQKTAEYFANGRRKPVSVTANSDFTLTLRFDNHEIRLLDMKPYLRPDTVFAAFREWDNFQRVYLDEQSAVCWDIDPTVDSEVVWNNKVDLCPDMVYLDSTPLGSPSGRAGSAAD